MHFLTILTPTYNRCKTLPNLYRSLCCQTMKDFEWIVVDDGSIDNTEELIKKYKAEGAINISYIHKENGGKHTALNAGIKLLDSILAIIVDSDDELLPDAVSEIMKYYQKYKDDQRIGSWSFLRCYSNGKPIISIEKNDIKYRIKGNRPGDMAEVFKSDILKKFPFPEFQDERFLSEDVVWIEIGKHYDTVYINIPIYKCEYLEGGLTANDKPMKFASPKGSMMRGKQLMCKECGIKSNIKGAIIFDCYKKVGNGTFSLDIRERILCVLVKPIAEYYYKKWSVSK